MKTGVEMVAEMQGLYGAFSFSELLLQKIWWRGDFQRERAVTTEGVPVRVIHSGRWNRLGGPDFRGARVVLGDGREVTGDVELHLHAADWNAHGHANDPAYDGVRLHVVLFPPAAGQRTYGAGGREIPVLSLLPLLRHDLEEYAADEAIERLSARPAGRIIEELGVLSVEALTQKLRRLAEMRWRQKVHFARLRVQRLGWAAACHQTALEILGYRFNRAPMLRLAGAFPLTAWAGDVSLETLLAAESVAWSRQGVRPANQPRARIGQYLNWVRARPDWPERWRALGASWPRIEALASTRAVRREANLASWRDRIGAEICGEVLGGSRLETLNVDGLLPLWAAENGAGEIDVFGGWYHWYPGDLPPMVPKSLRVLGISGTAAQPAVNGLAQGLLAWAGQDEAQRALSVGREA
jgi:hypothetical protein